MYFYVKRVDDLVILDIWETINSWGWRKFVRSFL